MIQTWTSLDQLSLFGGMCVRNCNSPGLISLLYSHIFAKLYPLPHWYIHKFLPSYFPTCFRGCGKLGTPLPPIWWPCPLVHTLGAEVFGMPSTLFSRSFSLEPMVALLNRNPFELSKRRFKLLLKITTATKQTLVKAWIRPKLCITEARNRVTQAMIHRMLEHTLQNRVHTYIKLC